MNLTGNPPALSSVGAGSLPDHGQNHSPGTRLRSGHQTVTQQPSVTEASVWTHQSDLTTKLKSCVLITGRLGRHFESGYSPWAPNQSCSRVSLDQREASKGAPRSTRGMLLAVLASLLNKHARHAWSFRGTASSIRQYVHMKYCVFSMWSLHK